MKEVIEKKINSMIAEHKQLSAQIAQLNNVLSQYNRKKIEIEGAIGTLQTLIPKTNVPEKTEEKTEEKVDNEIQDNKGNE